MALPPVSTDQAFTNSSLYPKSAGGLARLHSLLSTLLETKKQFGDCQGMVPSQSSEPKKIMEK